MKNRYIIEEIQLSKKDSVIPHPIWPGLIVWKIFDRLDNYYLLNCYIKKERAQEICDKKNNE